MREIDFKGTVALIGAGGKMGMRIAANLTKFGVSALFCENASKGLDRMKAAGYTATSLEKAVKIADFTILAIPDTAIAAVSKTVVPLMKPNAVLILLDPAAAFANEVTLRDDCTFVVTHPCHPPIFGEQETEEARRDLFGGVAAKQDIVIAKMQGDETAFEEARNLCIIMFSPVVNCHRITVEQMAILEPAAAEVCVATAAMFMKQAIDEAVKRGVPQEAANAFLLGHIQIPLAIVLKNTNPFSDAAKVAIDYGFQHIFKPDWQKVFDPDSIKEVIQRMLHPY